MNPASLLNGSVDERNYQQQPSSNNNNNPRSSLMPPGFGGNMGTGTARLQPFNFQSQQQPQATPNASHQSHLPHHHQASSHQNEDNYYSVNNNGSGGGNSSQVSSSILNPYTAAVQNLQEQQQDSYYTPSRGAVSFQNQLQQQQPSRKNVNTVMNNNNSNAVNNGLHLPSEVLFANERPGMRPVPDSAFMISGFSLHNNNNNSSPNNGNSMIGGRHSVERSYSVELAAQQASSAALSPFAQRLAKKMNQTIQFERMPEHLQNNHDDDFEGNVLNRDMMEMMHGYGTDHQNQNQHSILGPLHDGSAMVGSNNPYGKNRARTPLLAGGGNRPNQQQQQQRGTSPSIVRSRYSASLNRSTSHTSSQATASTRMRIGSFVVDDPEASGELDKRLRMGVSARRDEINRRQLTRLHRPTAAIADYQAIEPPVQEPGHPDTIHRRRAQLVHTTSVMRDRTPLRAMTRQDWDDARRQHSFSQELRRHSAEVTKRSISQAAAPYVHKHRGTDHTYLSEGAKWFTTPSPRIGHPCRITLASNEYGPSPGPGSYHVPSSFLGR